ncbi:putative polysaccharide biosynthesis protein [Defluviitalea phaphyphila]|uniref:putative polysaccharide biosynthesis protein n=1 Tax=Defluviitalea phaphyphila TaxID=1473580 RepID=UPI0007319845|nr:polysaccharide biosynthesis protein [Defluviitalea phaphyphila]
MTKQNTGGILVKQAAILAVASLIVRVIGLVYRWPLTNMIGDFGNSLYGIAFTIYIFFFILSSSGITAAVSKMVSERIALKQYKNAHKVFKISLLIATITGMGASLALWFGASPILNFIAKSPKAIYSIRALSPTLFIVAIMGVFRGYFQGMNTMVPTAISQIIEQIFNAIFSIFLAGFFLKYGIEFGAAGGTMGTGIGALAGLIFLILIYILIRSRIIKKFKKQKDCYIEESFLDISKMLFAISIPIIIGSTIASITNLIDMKMIMSILQSMDMTEVQINELYGQFVGKYVTLTNLPVSLSAALAVAVVPNIAASIALKEKNIVSNKVNLAIRIAMILAAPSAVGLFVLGDNILMMLFPKYPLGGDLLRIGAVVIIFLSLVQVLTAILQGIGKSHVPAVNAGIGSFIKIILNFFLISIPSLNVKGAIISAIFSYIIMTYLDMKAVINLTKVKIQVVNNFIKPIVAAISMGVFSWIFYKIIFWGINSNTFATLGSIILSMIIYVSILLSIGGIKTEELSVIPMGKRISDKLIKLGIIRE